MPEYHDYKWVKITLSGGFTFYMKDKFFDEKIITQANQFGLRWIPAPTQMYQKVGSETSEKLTLKLDEKTGFNAAMLQHATLVEKEVEVVK